MKTQEELTNYLINVGVLKSPQIIEAFRAIDRKDFIPKDLIDLAYEDMPLPIGYGQTISQPYVVAFMLELLEPKSGDKILDIGSGSGWTTTLLAYIVTIEGKKGAVFAIERIPELKEFGEANCAKYNFIEKKSAKFICADGTKGLVNESPFDAIQAAAAASKDIPHSWKDQIKIGGRIVAPIAGSIWRFTKKSETEFIEEEFYGFSFVPLISDKLV